VAFVAVLGDSGGSNALLGLFTGRAATIFAVAAFLAVANGVVVQIVMLARLFYGMARHRQLPGLFTRVNSLTRTPINASLAAGAIVLSAAVTLPFERLLVIANALTLVVFVLVNLSLWRIHRRTSDPTTFAAPAWAPPPAVVISILMAGAEMLN
jgi:amino acid transporter